MTQGAPPLFAGIEAGGTKFVLATGVSPSRTHARQVIPTTGPRETLAAAAAWLRSQGPLAALGIASFGPVDLDRGSPDWGRIAATPKPGWSGCDMVGFFQRSLGIPVGFDTDVNGAALAELRLGAGRAGGSLAYVTVGTGIGGGLVIDGRLVHGAAHPEMGHVPVRKADWDAGFGGTCPHHGDCLEGLASGPAILARWGSPLSGLPRDHPGHDLIAGYLAQLCFNLFAMTAVETVVLGGGVMNAPALLDKVAARVREIDAGYLPGGAKHRVVGPALGGDSGIAGALMLAEMAYAEGVPPG